MLRINKLTFTYGNKLIFDQLSLNIRNNKMTLFLAPNNSGKTTLIYLLSGLLPSNNCIKNYKYYLNQKDGKNYVKTIGVVFNNLDAQFITGSVIEELSLPLVNLGFRKDKIIEIVEEQIKFFVIDFENKSINKLTNLEKLTLLLAVATIHRPKILLLDDIFNNINPVDYEYLSKILKKITTLRHIAIFMTSSNIHHALYFDYVFLYNKKIVIEAPLEKILDKENILRKEGIKVPDLIKTCVILKDYDLIKDFVYNERTLVDRLWG